MPVSELVTVMVAPAMTALLGSVTRPSMVPRSCPQQVKVAAANQRIDRLITGNRCMRGSFFVLSRFFTVTLTVMFLSQMITPRWGGLHPANPSDAPTPPLDSFLLLLRRRIESDVFLERK